MQCERVVLLTQHGAAAVHNNLCGEHAVTAAFQTRRGPGALYAETLASYGASDTFPHDAAEGLITILSLETEAVAARARNGK